MDKEQVYYIVAEDILPEALQKTIRAKEMLRRGEVEGVAQATEKLGIARSTFYKYKDGIHTFFDYGSMDILNLSLTLDHTPGVLSRVLNEIARLGGNVLTINQSLPSHGAALVTISLGLGEDLRHDELLRELRALPGVLDARIGKKEDIGGSYD